jgi:hypothetical protein
MEQQPLDDNFDGPSVRSSRSTFVAKCPHCREPFHYMLFRFEVANDDGYCRIDCSNCKESFVLKMRNPREARALTPSKQHQIHEWHEDPYEGDPTLIATDIVLHNLDRARPEWAYDYNGPPLYICASSGINLEQFAKAQLQDSASKIDLEWRSAEQYLLARSGPAPQAVLVRLALSCCCGVKHCATYYADPKLGVFDTPNLSVRCLLADVSGANLEEYLGGIASKTDIMTLLEKLVIRWHITADQILITVPFVGHPWMRASDKQAIWAWLLSILDPSKTILVTRPATRTSYKELLEADGLDYKLLSRYGLEAKLISAGLAKQDFHAKVYAGLSTETVEVFSGSANLVRGSSVENMTFRSMSAQAFQQRYLDKLNLSIPQPMVRPKLFALMQFAEGCWRTADHTDLPVPA